MAKQFQGQALGLKSQRQGLPRGGHGWPPAKLLPEVLHSTLSPCSERCHSSTQGLSPNCTPELLASPLALAGPQARKTSLAVSQYPRALLSTGDMTWASEACGILHLCVQGLAQWDTVNVPLRLQEWRNGGDFNAILSEGSGSLICHPLLLPGQGNWTKESYVSPSTDTLPKVQIFWV